MSRKKVYRTIGLMSGTSVDGVDAALLETDGFGHVEPLDFISLPYDDRLKSKVKACFGSRDPQDSAVSEAGRLITFKHLEAVLALLEKAGLGAGDIDVIGFHGQTITHDPDKHLSIQIGDGKLLAQETGIDVVNDFRSADVKAGGQGAPFLPLYHMARAKALEAPLAVINIGGVGNITWIGGGAEELAAFDTGPGAGLIDDFILQRTGAAYDDEGKLAKAGRVHDDVLESWLDHEYFEKPFPKSLDRNDWDIVQVNRLNTEDGAATLSAFTVEAIARGVKLLPKPPQQFLVTGGGRHNRYLMDHLQIALEAPVRAVEEVGWNGDALEAEGFGYLAVRSLLGQPLSLPLTTGVPKPISGGVLHKGHS